MLASNKAGFSVSANDGGTIKNIHLNCGGTAGACKYGLVHNSLDMGYLPKIAHPYRSQMRRIRTPFFLSISNRGRILGGETVKRPLADSGRDTALQPELFVTNVNIGHVENIFINDVDIKEVYGESQAKQPLGSRWPAYTDQARTTPLIVGYQIPDWLGKFPSPAFGGKLGKSPSPDGCSSRCLKNVEFHGIDLIVKGGNPLSDAESSPREMGVGQFNLRNLAEDARGSKIPAYGYYVRHVRGLRMTDCSIGVEKDDGRYAIVLEDVEDGILENVILENVTLEKLENNQELIKMSNCKDISCKSWS